MNLLNLTKTIKRTIPYIPKFSLELPIKNNTKINLQPTMQIIEYDILENTKKLNEYMIKRSEKEVININELIKLYNKREHMIYDLINYNNSNEIEINKNTNNKIIMNENCANLLNKVKFNNNKHIFEYKIGDFLLKWWNNEYYKKYREILLDKKNDLPDWIYGLSIEYPIGFEKMNMEWIKKTNFKHSFELFMVTIPKQLYELNYQDNSIYNYNEINNIDYETEEINKNLRLIHSKIAIMSRRMDIVNKYEKCNYNIKQYLEKYTISYIYETKFEGECISSLIDIINELDAKKWLLKEYKNFYDSYDDDTMKKILNHPKFNKNHSDGSCAWTFLHVKKYFEIGPEKYALAFMNNNNK